MTRFNYDKLQKCPHCALTHWEATKRVLCARCGKDMTVKVKTTTVVINGRHVDREGK